MSISDKVQPANAGRVMISATKRGAKLVLPAAMYAIFVTETSSFSQSASSGRFAKFAHSRTKRSGWKLAAMPL
jgi:hypothetical protein